jgi:hypothetical protein
MRFPVPHGNFLCDDLCNMFAKIIALANAGLRERIIHVMCF